MSNSVILRGIEALLEEHIAEGGAVALTRRVATRGLSVEANIAEFAVNSQKGGTIGADIVATLADGRIVARYVLTVTSPKATFGKATSNAQKSRQVESADIKQFFIQINLLDKEAIRKYATDAISTLEVTDTSIQICVVNPNGTIIFDSFKC